MIIISKFIIPINTITRIIIAVPHKAEYETGFAKWVDRIANMTKQIGCRAIFYAHPDTIGPLKTVLKTGRYHIRNEFETLECWDNIIMLANEVLDDDLFIVISARRTSVSFNTDFEAMPSFLSKYFANNNLVVLYPEQFESNDEITYFTDPLLNDVQSNSPRFFGLRSFFHRLIVKKKKWTHRNRKKKIEIKS